jgi:hypothetical protein
VPGYSTRTSRPALFLDRYTSVGELISCFYSDATVGSISVSATATAFNTSSDKRLKEDPKDVTNSGDLIDAIKIHDFKWRASDERSISVFAHDVYEVFPAAVTKGAKELTWGVDYSKFEPLILKEVKQLRMRVAALEPHPAID